jgi:NAD(P)H-nitrite reductase large subunit
MDDKVIVCRCEEITAGQIREAIREGAVDVSGVKRRTRAGMGLCQGRTCERLVMRILSEELGKPISEFEPDTVRPPVMSITFGLLAGEADEENC